MEGVVERFVDQSASVRSVGELLDCLSQVRRHLGYEHFAYGGLGLPDADWRYPELPPAIVVDYPADWIGRYVEKRYLSADPVLRLSPSAVADFTWTELGPISEREQLVMNECADIGLSTGLTIPIHGPRGAIHVVSFAGARGQVEQPTPTVRAMLRLIAVQFHVAYTRLESSSSPAQWAGALTVREREMLLWAARGKSCWDTGVILGLSEHTVRFHLRNAMEKLQTASKIVAVVKAITLGLIDP